MTTFSPRFRATLPALAGSAALAILATFPLVLTPLSRLVGHPDVDVTNHAWGPWWWWLTLGRGELPWRTTLLGAPQGGVLWFIDPIGAAIGAPFVGLLGIVGAYNLVILVSVGAAAWASRRLAMSLGAPAPASWLAGAAAACGPYLLCEVHNGVSEAVGVAWGTLALAASRRALAEDTRRAWIVTGVWLGVAAVGTWYYAFSAGLTLGAWMALETVANVRRGEIPGKAAVGRLVRRLLLVGGPAAAIAAGPLAALTGSIRSPDSLVVRGEVDAAVRELLLAHNAVDPRAFVAPLGFQSVDLAARGEAFLHSSYLGLLALALAAVALRVRPDLRRVALGVLPAAVLSLGAYLWWGGAWAKPFGVRIALPFAWLLRVLPDAGASHAQRLAWPVVATTAALAAIGVAEVTRDVRRQAVLGLLVVADLLLASPWPLARVDELDVRAHARIGALRREARAHGEAGADGVLDLPAESGATMATSRYLVYQAASEAPIPYRPDARGGTTRLYGMPWFNVLFLPSSARDEQTEALRRVLADATKVDLRAAEQDAKIRWIVLHRELERGAGDVAALEAQLRAWFGAPDELGPHLTWDVRARKDDGGRVLKP